MKKFKKIYIEITNNCNLNCSFCHNNSRNKAFMTITDFNHIIDEIKPYTKYIYLHVKGEPLMHPNLDILLDICDKANIFVNITTNGVLLKKNRDILYNHKCIRQINVSLHCENDIEDYFENVFNTCNYLSDHIYISYRLWTLKDGRLDDKEDILEELKEYYNLSTEIVDKIKKSNNVEIKSNIYINKDNVFEWPTLNSTYNRDGYCHGVIDHIGILVDGTVVPCCLDGEGIVNLGNVFSTPFVEIINSDRFKNIENGFKDNKCVEDLCKKCRFKNKFNEVDYE